MLTIADEPTAFNQKSSVYNYLDVEPASGKSTRATRLVTMVITYIRRCLNAQVHSANICRVLVHYLYWLASIHHGEYRGPGKF